MRSTTAGSTRRKLFAIAAAGLVLGVGGTMTLAAWVDTEWVFGGVDGGQDPDTPGVGTSTFVVEQNPTSPFSGTGWLENATNPGSPLVFSGSPLALSPGDVTYAPVALRTTADSVSGTVDPQVAVAAAGVATDDDPGELWAALELRVGVADLDDSDPAPACNATTMGDATYAIIATGVGLSTAITGGQSLEAASGNILHYCFEITLPDDAPNTLQGRTVAPAWQFISESD